MGGCETNQLGRPGRTAIVIAHPGHELRVHRWIEVTQPWVFVLTDGSGQSGRSRLPSTSAVLERAGARRGSIYGRASDLEMYSAILRRDCGLFRELAVDLAREFRSADVDFVAGDATEGYNSVHDVCRLVVNAAIRLVDIAQRSSVDNYEFCLVRSPDDWPDPDGTEIRRLVLSDEALDRKMAAARGYPELSAETEAQIREHGIESFRVESFRSTPSDLIPFPPEVPPFYERRGVKQVAAGRYRVVLRFREHVYSIASDLREFVDNRARRLACES